MFDLTGKKAIVTGSTQGIGKAVAETLYKQGATVYIIGATSMEKCKTVSDSLGERAIPVLCDLRAADCAEKLYKVTGDVDILVLNASIQYKKPWNEITPEEYETQMNMNFRSSLFLIQKYYDGMKAKKWGRIITVGSVQQHKPHKEMLVYAASKAAQMNMVKNLAKQISCYGITVNNIAPGVIATPRNAYALADKTYAPQVLAGIPVGYAGESTDCAGAVLLLCSEEGRYINGADIVVDGGMQL